MSRTPPPPADCPRSEGTKNLPVIIVGGGQLNSAGRTRGGREAVSLATFLGRGGGQKGQELERANDAFPFQSCTLRSILLVCTRRAGRALVRRQPRPWPIRRPLFARQIPSSIHGAKKFATASLAAPDDLPTRRTGNPVATGVVSPPSLRISILAAGWDFAGLVRLLEQPVVKTNNNGSEGIKKKERQDEAHRNGQWAHS